MESNSRFAEVEAEIRALCRTRNAGSIFVLTDSNVSKLTAGLLPDVPRLVIAAGEHTKTLEGARKVWQFLVDEKAVRSSVLVNVGGGMISDLGGFAAATFMRGIGHVNVPTTLLAAVDAAIGGKTGVNFAGLKNEIGAFSLPLGVYPLTETFGSLSEEEWLSGAGEAIKTGLLESEELFEKTVSEDFIIRREPEVVEEVVRRCAAFKQKIVDEDFRESGLRKILNLGHTAGHAIEAIRMETGRPMPHGICVAHGLLVALRKSRDEAGLDRRVTDRYAAILEKYFPPLEFSQETWLRVWKLMGRDKKNSEAGKPSWVLLKAIGEAVI